MGGAGQAGGGGRVEDGQGVEVGVGHGGGLRLSCSFGWAGLLCPIRARTQHLPGDSGLCRPTLKRHLIVWCSGFLCVKPGRLGPGQRP